MLLQSMESQIVQHNWVTNTFTFFSFSIRLSRFIHVVACVSTLCVFVSACISW